MNIDMDTYKIVSTSFLLRLWQVKANENIIWRASLESSRTGERWNFADLEALFNFLRRQTAHPGDYRKEASRQPNTAADVHDPNRMMSSIANTDVEV